MTTVIILDNEKASITETTKILNDLNIYDIKIISYQNEKLFFKDFAFFPKYSIFILGIILRNNNGIEIAKLINNSILGATIIFISAHLTKAPDVYATDHCYFIYKPQIKNSLPLAIEKAITITQNKRIFIYIKLKNCCLIIHCDKIYYFERVKRQTFIFKVKTKVAVYKNFNYFLNQLPDYFVRCHCSYIVNFDKVTSIFRNKLTLDNGVIIPISRTYQKYVHERFNQYLLNR